MLLPYHAWPAQCNSRPHRRTRFRAFDILQKWREDGGFRSRVTISAPFSQKPFNARSLFYTHYTKGQCADISDFHAGVCRFQCVRWRVARSTIWPRSIWPTVSAAYWPSASKDRPNKPPRCLSLIHISAWKTALHPIILTRWSSDFRFRWWVWWCRCAGVNAGCKIRRTCIS